MVVVVMVMMVMMRYLVFKNGCSPKWCWLLSVQMSEEENEGSRKDVKRTILYLVT